MGGVFILVLLAGIGLAIAYAYSPAKRHLRGAERAAESANRYVARLRSEVRRLDSEVSDSADQYVSVTVDGRRRDVPIEDLRRDGVKQVRWGALQAAGFHTLADLHGVSDARLQAIEGVGPTTASRVLAGARAREADIVALPVPLPTPRIPASWNLLRSLIVRRMVHDGLGDSMERLRRQTTDLGARLGRIRRSVTFWRWLFRQDESREGTDLVAELRTLRGSALRLPDGAAARHVRGVLEQGAARASELAHAPDLVRPYGRYRDELDEAAAQTIRAVGAAPEPPRPKPAVAAETARTVPEQTVVEVALEPSRQTEEPSVATTALATEPVDFVELVDRMLERTDAEQQQILVARFARHESRRDVASFLDLDPGRVARVERRFIQDLVVASNGVRHQLESVLDDGVIEFEELTHGSADPDWPRPLYVHAARVCLTGADTFVDIQRFFRAEKETLALDLQGSTEFVLGRLTEDELLRRAESITPALLELPRSEVISSVAERVRGRVRGDRIIPSTFTLPRVVRAAIRAEGRDISLATLQQRCQAAAAACGEALHVDMTRLRGIARSMPEVTLLDANTVSPHQLDPTYGREWRDLFVQCIRDSGRALSVPQFLDDNPEAPFDAEGLATLLEDDPRVVRVGRRLYADASEEREGSLRVTALIEEALSTEPRPWTLGELLEFVRERRDFRGAQLSRYLDSLPDVVRYDDFAVGRDGLDRAGMLSLLTNEGWLAYRIDQLYDGAPICSDDLWLGGGAGYPDLAEEEGLEIVEASRHWESVTAQWQDAVFYTPKEQA